MNLYPLFRARNSYQSAGYTKTKVKFPLNPLFIKGVLGSHSKHDHFNFCNTSLILSFRLPNPNNPYPHTDKFYS